MAPLLKQIRHGALIALGGEGFQLFTSPVFGASAGGANQFAEADRPLPVVGFVAALFAGQAHTSTLLGSKPLVLRQSTQAALKACHSPTKSSCLHTSMRPGSVVEM
jgi:hypothetical protein